MKAIVKTKAGPGAEYTDVDIPNIKSDELLIKIHAASICGSDLPIYNGDALAARGMKPPFIFGHELCGEVVEIGDKAKGFTKGDFVSVESHIFCGMCYQCRNDQRHVCSNLQILGIDTQGGFAEYAAIPARCAWKHADDTLKDIGSIMEPLGNAVFATLAEDIVGKTVLVSGLGPQGLFAVEIAKATGAAKVIATEASAFRKKLGEQMGADVIIDPMEGDTVKKIIEAGGEKSGVDIVVEMSGNPTAINTALEAVKPAGSVIAFGLPKGNITIDYGNQIIFKALRMQGITGREIFRSWYKMESLLRSKAINPRPVITHTFKMKDFEKAFAVAADPKKECGKVILVP
ncbi:MAG: L-threonine 3-dehydrogenase [Elusimicrobiota bacterium]|jgi:threonine 3-dehydrogenase|nr:L-threonine 3-dehydrogenase [Elusimicrobiota bacterium]